MSIGKKTAKQKVKEKIILSNAYYEGRKQGALEEIVLFINYIKSNVNINEKDLLCWLNKRKAIKKVECEKK